jgi:transketolase
VLHFVPQTELTRVRNLDAEPTERAAAFSDACRINALYAIAMAGSGHIGTSFSCLDLLSWLYLEVLEDGDRSFSSKGHDAPALYAVLTATGRLPFDGIHALRRLDGLPGHPDVVRTPEVVTSTGSLGMGISKAKGFVRADRLAGRRGRVFVLTGDGELQEGQFWESLGSAHNERMGEITAIVDHNKIQSDTWVSEVSNLGDVEAKVRAFGWATARCDGNNTAAFANKLAALLESAPDRPKLLVADTVKGAGVSCMEPHDLPVAGTSLYAYHSGAPSAVDYQCGLDELHTRLDERLAALGAGPIVLIGAAPSPRRPQPGRPQNLVAAYAEALVATGEAEPRLVSLDADLVLDTGQIGFRDRFPARFVECGIAEQDMVSQAGALALAGLLPVVHSFACFLAARPNEQIYNNATEGSRVIYVGSLAGIVPGGPGHSHQSVRDISVLGAMPGMALLEPYCEAQVHAALRWAVDEADGPVYLRLVTTQWELGFDPPELEPLVPGRGTVLREGTDALLVTTGPVLVAQAWAAAERLSELDVDAGVVALPWLRDVDGQWLSDVARGAAVFVLDNHYPVGGQGDAVLAAGVPIHKFAVDEIPRCGTNDEVLRAHRLDAESVAERVAEMAHAAV